MSDSFGCCGSWQVCSDAKCADEAMCVNPKLKSSCSYATHLSNGFNFFNPVFKAGPYLEIGNRQYYIGISSGSGSRSISESSATSLRDNGLVLAPFLLSKAEVERPEINDPCGFKVLFKFEDETFVVKNVNVRALRQESAEHVAMHLKDVGLNAQVLAVDSNRAPMRTPSPHLKSDSTVVPECKEGLSTVEPIPSMSVPEPVSAPISVEESDNTCPSVEVIKPKGSYDQLSLFDML